MLDRFLRENTKWKWKKNNSDFIYIATVAEILSTVNIGESPWRAKGKRDVN